MFMLLKNRIKKRDRVRCLYNIEAGNGYEYQTINKLGTIMLKEDGEYGIKFDDYICGHSLVSNKGICYCKNGYGLWMKEYYFAKISKEEDIQEYIIDEEYKEQLYKEFYNRVIDDLKEKGLISEELFKDNRPKFPESKRPRYPNPVHWGC